MSKLKSADDAMVRVNIHLTRAQDAILRKVAIASDDSVAGLIRRAVEIVYQGKGGK